MKAILVAGVGYRNLRDLSVGPLLIERWQDEEWPAGVVLADLSYDPIGMLHDFDTWPTYERVIFVVGVTGPGVAGSITCHHWERHLPDLDTIQACVAEAAMGVISLENLLTITSYFDKLPRDVIVVEVEAADSSWGEGFTPELENVLPQVRTVVCQHLD